jgi:hypothetical protein
MLFDSFHVDLKLSLSRNLNRKMLPTAINGVAQRVNRCKVTVSADDHLLTGAFFPVT